MDILKLIRERQSVKAPYDAGRPIAKQSLPCLVLKPSQFNCFPIGEKLVGLLPSCGFR